MAFCRIGERAFKKPDPYSDTCAAVVDENNDAELIGGRKTEKPRKAYAILMAAARAVFDEGFDVYMQRLEADGFFRKKWILRK